ncbi:hypothetical protein [Sulfurovum sp. NBC37-1]|uniref:hypothetical protein n=1 Tax=Sulfurovum sp. (strain NBC37-1) TaxID=387093 RepID=UPI0001587961|nr:hypothetical protein [Sulfurovum sp. NBC37-1]BAF72675.1 hypothetical protein SUN_1728 [Sulfurovum sp. NBC37-1]
MKSIILLFLVFSFTVTFADYPTKEGKKIFAGSIHSRAGEKRSDLKGGFYLGEESKNFRGVQILSQGCSANAYIRERSEYGQSLLVTLQPNPLTVNCSSIIGTNTVRAKVNNFDNKFFSEDAIVDFGLQRYRIVEVIDRSTVSLCKVVKNRCEDFKFKKSFSDNLVLPAFYYKSKARVKNNVVTFVSGDYLPSFAKRAFRKRLLSVEIDGEWYFLQKRLDRFSFSFSDSNRAIFNDEERDVLIRFQPTYTVELVLKRTSGQGLEESWMVRSDYDGWRYKSSGSGVAKNKPHIFRIGNKDLLTISPHSISSKNKIIAPEIVFLDENKNSSIRLLSGMGDPNGKIIANIGSIYTRRDGKIGKTLYIKESGRDSYGWRAIE